MGFHFSSKLLEILSNAHRTGFVKARSALAHLEISPAPEAPQVGGELDGFEPGGEQFHQHGPPAVVHPRGVHQAEALLQAHAQHGHLGPLAVFQADAAVFVPSERYE